MSDGQRILLADDDPDIRALVRYRLQKAGYEVIDAGDGQTALTLAQEHHPDLAVLDVMMPGMDGFQVTAALRADSKTASIPVILLTARVHAADVERGFAAGADDYIRKPFSPQELLLRVQRAVGRR